MAFLPHSDTHAPDQIRIEKTGPFESDAHVLPVLPKVLLPVWQYIPLSVLRGNHFRKFLPVQYQCGKSPRHGYLQWENRSTPDTALVFLL